MPKRLLYLDVLNIIAIFGVAIPHAWATYGGIFLMSSGAMLMQPSKAAPVGTFYRKRLPKLVIPLVAWSLLYYVFGQWLSTDYGFDWAEMARRTVNGGLVGHFWFSYMLIQVYLAAPFLYNIFYNARPAYFVWFFALLFAFDSLTPVLVHLFDFHYLLMNQMFTQYIGYFVLGFVLTRFDVATWRGRWLCVLGFLAGAAFTAWATWRLKIAGDPDPFLFMRYEGANVALTAICLFLLFKSLDYSRLEPHAKKLAMVSGATYGIYLSHVLVRDALNVAGLGVMDLSLALGGPTLGILANWLLIYVCSFLVVMALVRTPALRRIVS